MPTFDFVCERCGMPGRAWREKKPPRFCSIACRGNAHIAHPGKTRYVITDEMHEEIRRVYQGETGRNQVNELAERIGLPRWKVTRYAIEKGFVAKKRKEPNWSDEELRVLNRSAHRRPEVIQRRLRDRGFRRSVTGIVLKRKRMRFLANLDGQSATSLAGCFGVDAKTVTRWIERGWLKAKKRGTKRTEVQGGDIWFIKDAWVRDFVVNSVDVVDLRKVDKYWFVDLLAGDGDMGPGPARDTIQMYSEPKEEFAKESEIIEIFAEAQGF